MEPLVWAKAGAAGCTIPPRLATSNIRLTTALNAFIGHLGSDFLMIAFDFNHGRRQGKPSVLQVPSPAFQAGYAPGVLFFQKLFQKRV
jgi:hypothetical protein